jgi:N-methylhydantoinase A
MMREILMEEAPGISVTLSHELSREYREYERASTAVLDAYIKPIVRGYLETIGRELSTKGFTGQFLLTRSGGGAMNASLASDQPVQLILSGPAGGVTGAAALSRSVATPNLITIDMGGTSLDASLIINNEPVLHHGAEFEQLPISMTSLYIHTIGAGGGSIAWLDRAGVLEVGPQSAGARPGPACYARGGLEPTVTDAALVLGYLGSDAPLGGTLRLNTELAEAALAPLAHQLGLSVKELAQGVLRISITKVVGAVRAITIELGRDPQDFGLLAYGGCGGVVATDVAHELGIPIVIIPPGQGAFSAMGMLMADLQHDLAHTMVVPLLEMDRGLVELAYMEMELRGERLLAHQGLDHSRHVMTRSVDVRYRGQEHTVTVRYPQGDADVTSTISSDFAAVHERQYGHTMEDPVELTTLRVSVRGVVDKPQFPAVAPRVSGQPRAIATRSVFISSVEPHAPYRVFQREDLLAGDRIVGPAVIVERTATTVVHSGGSARVGHIGELVIDCG